MRRWGATALILLAAGGCARATVSPPGSGVGPRPAPSASAVPYWNSVEGGCPTLAGPNRELITEGPHGTANGTDDEYYYTRGCAYGHFEGSPAVDVDVDIKRGADPGTDQRADMEYGERVARGAGHLVIRFTGVGAGGMAITDRKTAGIAHPVVLAETYSGNASVSVHIRVDGPIRDEDDLRSHTGEMIAVLNDVLDDLRP